MKTKTLSLISTICFIVLFLSCMYFGSLGTVYLITNSDDERVKILQGAFSNWAIPIVCFVDIVAMSILFSMYIALSRHGRTIESIDKKEKMLDDAIRKYDLAVFKLIRKITEDDETIPPQIKSTQV